MYRVRSATFDRAIKRLPIDLAQARVLDIGSGSGFYMDRWLKAGAREVVGSDFTQAAVTALTRLFPTSDSIQLDIAGSVRQLAGQSFSVVSAMDVLFHITDDVAYDTALQNISNLLQPGGFFLFSDNFVRSGTLRADYQVSRSLPQIAGSLDRAGFRVVSRVPMFILMNSPVDSTNVVMKWMWRGVRFLAARPGFRGYATGLALYPLERVLLLAVRDGPSTKLMTCQKRREDVDSRGLIS
jgi:SAM-dependent methyltransferase